MSFIIRKKTILSGAIYKTDACRNFVVSLNLFKNYTFNIYYILYIERTATKKIEK